MSLVPTAATPDGIVRLRRSLAVLDDQRAALAEAGDLDALAIGLAQLEPILRDLRDLARAIEDDVARLMPAKTVEVPGLGMVERRRGTDRKSWDWEGLLPTLIRLVVDPDGTGEMPDAGEVVSRMRALISEVIGVTPSKGPRVRQLRELGLDPDEWCESSPGRVSVQIHGGES